MKLGYCANYIIQQGVITDTHNLFVYVCYELEWLLTNHNIRVVVYFCCSLYDDLIDHSSSPET